MSNCPFCNLDAPASSATPNTADGKRPAGLLRRAWGGVRWLFPTAVLMLMPKCPMCLAAYVACFTGIGVSVSTARWMQIAMWALCLGSLAYLIVRHFPSFKRLMGVRRVNHA